MMLSRSRILMIVAAILVGPIPVGAFQTRKAMGLNKSHATQHAVFDANRISCIMMNNGQFVSHVVTGNSGMEWPKGSFNLIDFASGIWIAGKVRSDGSVRTATAEYTSEFLPGKILHNGTPDDPTNSKYKWYKITRNDLYNPGPDYHAWPSADGAPVDESGKPLLYGHQTLWCVFNDADDEAHSGSFVFRTAPIGVEVQMTVWGYDHAGILGDVMFVKSMMIHRGTETLDSAFFAIWDDPDIGDAGDDYAGCDSSLGIGYAYNGDKNDASYGGAPPAIGSCILQGPIIPSPGDTAFVSGRTIPGFRNLPVYSFYHIINANIFPYRDPITADEAFQCLKGNFLDGSTRINPITSELTRFHYPGDPETDSGWTAANPTVTRPGNRRTITSFGPFTFAPGDTQDIVFAVIIARGTNNLNSVTRLKWFSSAIQQAYNAGSFFPVPSSPPTGNKPAQFGLRQNYPNPFNLSTKIPFSVKREGRIMLEICDLIGRRVRILKNEVMQPGDYETEWNGLNDEGNAVNSGPYFVRIATNGGVSTIKMMVAK